MWLFKNMQLFLYLKIMQSSILESLIKDSVEHQCIKYGLIRKGFGGHKISGNGYCFLFLEISNALLPYQRI